MLESPQEGGARFAEGGGRFTGNAPHDTPPSLPHLEASRVVLGLAAAQGAWLSSGERAYHSELGRCPLQ
jgi:hypothetical protein